MYFTRILLSIVFVLFASTTLAAQPEKSLVCHVGSQLSSIGETYLENDTCTPPGDWVVEDDGEFICPDAGKVDLIAVSKKANHVGNEVHYFLDGDFEWVDYYPEEGVGDAADFEDNTNPPNGIDDGCEPDDYQLTCPCWDDFTYVELVAQLDSWYLGDSPTTDEECGPFFGGTKYNGVRWSSESTQIYTSYNPSCGFSRRATTIYQSYSLDATEYNQCRTELDDVKAVAVVCNPVP